MKFGFQHQSGLNLFIMGSLLEAEFWQKMGNNINLFVKGNNISQSIL
jgi:hypothetical protein